MPVAIPESGYLGQLLKKRSNPRRLGSWQSDLERHQFLRPHQGQVVQDSSVKARDSTLTQQTARSTTGAWTVVHLSWVSSLINSLVLEGLCSTQKPIRVITPAMLSANRKRSQQLLKHQRQPPTRSRLQRTRSTPSLSSPATSAQRSGQRRRLLRYGNLRRNYLRNILIYHTNYPHYL